MKEFTTKRGSLTFGADRLMMEETLVDYLRSTYGGFWKKGDMSHKMFFLVTIALISFYTFFTAAAFFTAPLQTQLYVVGLVLMAISALILYEYLNGVEKEKFIHYSDINSVKYVEGFSILTCPRFVINYSEGEKIRYVVMPVSFMPGVQDTVDEIIDEFEDRDITVI